MKRLTYFVVLTFSFLMIPGGCEFVEHGKEAFLGNYSTEIDYKNSQVELAIDLNTDGDDNLATNPPTSFQAIDSASKEQFINTYFTASSAVVSDLGGDSVKYSDSKRALRGIVKGQDSVLFQNSDMGSGVLMEGIVVDSSFLKTVGRSIDNDIYMTYQFSGTGSVTIGAYTRRGFVRGTVKMVAKK
jgi:hypothetical protein